MTVSLSVMHVGSGVAYLLSTVVAGDGNRDLSTPLTRYYAEAGTPPGHWHGAGITALGLHEAEQVTEQQLQLLVGHGLHPLTADPLGQAFPKIATIKQRIASRVASLAPELSGQQYTDAVQRITTEETARGDRGKAVAAFDYTFSAPKSVSALWGLADAGTQQIIANAHHEAVHQMLGFFESQLACTRIEHHRITRQTAVQGVISAWYDHYDSRAGDPQLHTHVVISNKALTTEDNQWRSLDGSPLHAATVAISETYNGVLADILTRDLGITWDPRVKGRDKNPTWEITGVPDTLITEFASRTVDIDCVAETLISDYIDRHGRRPSRTTITQLRQQATLMTRPKKEIHSLAELTGSWRHRAENLLGENPTNWVRQFSIEGKPLLLRADDVPAQAITDIAANVVATVADKRATFNHWLLHAEASRQTMGWRFATMADRQTILAAITRAAEATCKPITPTASTAPARFQRGDSSSTFRPAHSTRYTVEALYEAEERLLALSRDTNAPTVTLDTIETAVQASPGSVTLSSDQAEALTAIAVSGRVIDLLIGPAGAGKTTAMNTLKQAWETQHGPGSVVGLAPSATAAQVLGEDLGIPTENTAKWLADHHAKGLSFVKG